MPDAADLRETEPIPEPPYVRVIGKAVAALEILLEGAERAAPSVRSGPTAPRPTDPAPPGDPP